MQFQNISLVRAAHAAVFLIAVLGGHFASAEEVVREWQFSRNGDRQGWSIPERMTGAVFGGALWLTPSPKTTDVAVLSSFAYQACGDYDIWNRLSAGEKMKQDGPSNSGELSQAGPASVNVASPVDLALVVVPRVDAQLVVEVRLLNLSPLNNIDLKWRAKAAPKKQWAVKRRGIKPDVKQWQEVNFYLDRSWAGSIDQIALGISENVIRGDIWIASVKIKWCKPEPESVRPDVASAALVPQLSVPALTQDRLAEAFKVLDECLVVDVPAYGFPYPFMKGSSDNRYGDYAWLSQDTCLNAAAAAWVNQSFAENVMRGVAEIQSANPDGRISGYLWEPYIGQPSEINNRPDGFEAMHAVALRTRDAALRATIYDSMRKALDWWLSPVKRDAITGLIMGDAEEALNFGVLEGRTQFLVQSRAPVDLNGVIVAAAVLTADLASRLERGGDAAHYRQIAKELMASMNMWMWNQGDGFYHDYDILRRRLSTKTTAQAFFALREGITTKERRDRLIAHLTDPGEFNWGRTPPVTNARRADVKDEQNTVLAYTLMNIMAGLDECGRFDLASELNWQMLKTLGSFRESYAADGTGAECRRFGVSASAFIQGVVSHLFGIVYEGTSDSVRIAPIIPKCLYGQTITLSNLILPTGGETRLSVEVRQDSARNARIAIKITGQLPKGDLEVALPGTDSRTIVPSQHSYITEFR